MIVQRTEEWHRQRLGKATASRIADIVARTKTGWGASRANYAAELVAERLSGVRGDSFTSAAMQWGTDKEPEARDTYSFRFGYDVLECGFIDHPRVGMSGASPDGLIDDDGLVEIKCPNTATHIDTLLNQKIPAKYLTQIQWQLACTRRAWCDFVSYDPRMPEAMRLYVQRIERDDRLLASLETEVADFLAEIDQTVAQLRQIYEREPEREAGELLVNLVRAG